MTNDQALQIALGHHQAGRLAEAESLYRQILARSPDHADTLHLLGVLACQTRHLDAAVELIGRAIAINPSAAEYHCNLGNALRDQEQLDRAIDAYQRAVALRPDLAAAHYNLGNVLKAQGRLERAIDAFRMAIQLRPAYAEAHRNLASALAATGRLEEAVAAYDRAIQIDPGHAGAHNNRGNVRRTLGRLDDAIADYERAIALEPSAAGSQNNLGTALRERGELDRAIAAYERAIALQPTLAEAYENLGHALWSGNQLDRAAACFHQMIQRWPETPSAHRNLGNVLRAAGLLDEAAQCLERALELEPGHCETYCSLGEVLRIGGRLDEALACFRRALELEPDHSGAASRFLFHMHFHPGFTAEEILAEHRRWDATCARPLAGSIRLDRHDFSPDRPLRVGYVSPDFDQHPIGRFILPLLECHDHAQFNIFCYSSVRTPDAITAGCRARADTWREVRGTSDEALARLIREDRIDVLVDLTMHMAENRLLVFARKPSPVQVTYLAYCSTTGLGTMDYRLTDPYLDLPGLAERPYSEQTIHLPETYWCYQPVLPGQATNRAPAPRAGPIAFGCLNTFSKVSAACLESWFRLLRALPGARLLLHANPGSHRGRVRALAERQGVAPDRVMFVGTVTPAEYFALYEQIDIALDTLPYCGGTTTCDALWMGVPVVSLAGRTAVGRSGLSILSNIGIPDLVASAPDHYVETAVALASDRARLAELRATLRDRMQSSPLMDAPRYARGVEDAYRTMWQRRCAAAG